MEATPMHNERKPEGCTNDDYMHDMMGMRSPRVVASGRGHRVDTRCFAAMSRNRECTCGMLTTRYESSRHEIRAATIVLHLDIET